MELTQILPVSIPKESLLVSGLKDIQEHGAEDRKTYKNNSEHSACMQACYCYSGGKKCVIVIVISVLLQCMSHIIIRILPVKLLTTNNV